MKKSTVVFLLFTFLTMLTSGQSWYWGKAGYSTGNFSAPFVQFADAIDSNQNTYITGSYSNTIQFGSTLLSSVSGITAYLVKYDSMGNALWAVQPLDSDAFSYSYGLSVAADKFGNIFVTGHFEGTITFGSYKLTGTPYYENTFVVKYSSLGNVVWAKQSGGGVDCIGYSVGTDDAGDAYITGFFGSKVSFGNDTINNPYESFDVFLVKYDSAGNVLWAKQSNVPSAVSYGWGYSLVTDRIGNVYITGQFLDTISFGPFTLLSQNTGSTYVAKYSPSGNVLWEKQSTNSTINSQARPSSIILTNTNNLYVTGFFVDAVKFGSQSLYSPSTNSTFLAKYDTGGNNLWAEQSSVGWYGGFLASDKLNHIYLTGETDNNPDTVKFGGFQLYSDPAVSLASFLIKFDSSGKALCGNILNDVFAQGLASDSSGRYVYSTGVFYDTLLLGTDTLFGNTRDVDVFAGRWLNCPVDAGINSIESGKFSTSVYPNPSNGTFTIQSSMVSGRWSVEVYDMMGEKVLMEIRLLADDNLINLTGQPNGIYLYRVITENGSLVGEGKVIIQK